MTYTISLARTLFQGLVAALLLLVSTEVSGAYDVVISEFLAENHSGWVDSDGDHSDWIELYNSGATTVDLAGWALSDKPEEKQKWVFPSIKLEPHGFLLVFASGKNRRNSGQPLHTNFKLGKKGDYLALNRPDGTTASPEFAPSYPPQRSDIAYGLPEEFFRQNGSSRSATLPPPTFLPIPTPGAPNLPGLETAVSAVNFSHLGGWFDQPLILALSCATPDAQIRFTRDGSTPTPTRGTLYDRSFKLGGSTVIRAIAFKKGHASSEVITHSFLIASQVASQTGADFPSSWGLREGKPVVAHYKMSTDVTQDPVYRDRILPALKALPTLALTVDSDALFGTEHGIYANPMETGAEWERTATAEYFPNQPDPGFETTCGVRIQGGWNRRPEECPKHSLRLIFGKKHGAQSLHYPLFGDGVRDFGELILRGGCNNSWLHWSSEERIRGDYLRDQWMRETYAAMGHLSARGRFVHLFLNGLYWGIYNMVERPDGRFVRAHLGDTEGALDVRNADRVLEGDEEAWNKLFKCANAGLSSEERFQEISEWLDIPTFIDYILLNLYGANADYDRASNWYAARPHRQGGKFVFFVWDGERTLEAASNNTLAYDDDLSPPRLFQKLRENSKFQAEFTQRARVLLGYGGALSPEVAGQRYARLAEQLEPAMVMESARWGNYRRDIHPYKTAPYDLYTVKNHWKPEVRRLLTDFFPQRTGLFRQQLLDAHFGPFPVSK